jgi:flagellar hook assembly protein FlgD
MVLAKSMPTSLALGRNMPNPFNPVTQIPVSVPAYYDGARLEVYSVDGRRVREFAVSVGISSVMWDGKDASGKAVASGVYIARLVAFRSGAPAETFAARMVVAR